MGRSFLRMLPRRLRGSREPRGDRRDVPSARSLTTRFLLPFGLLAALFSMFVIVWACEQQREHGRALISQQAALALEFNLAIRDYAARKIRPEIEARVSRDEFIPEAMSTSFISRSIFEEVRKKFPDCIIRFASDDPRNPVNTASPDELRMIEYFRRNPQESRRTEEIEIGGERYLAFFTPKFVKPDCLRCHGDPKDAPAAMVRRYGATASFHRRLGDVAGLDTVAVPLARVNAAVASAMRRHALILAAGFVLLFASVVVVFRLAVTRRLTAMAAHFHHLAEDAHSSRMTPVDLGGNDEIGVVGAAFNRLLGELRSAQASLEERVSQRTADLSRTNDDLQREITDRKRLEEDLRAAAWVDRLTGLPNRALFLDRLQHAIHRHQRDPESAYAVLFLDCDRFKTINDSLGHDVGDELLRQIAQRLRSAVRAVDSLSRQAQGATAARLGGDEFLILLDGLRSPREAEVAAERLLEVLSKPFKLGPHEVVSTASIGIVTSDCRHERAEEVLRDADTAMYEAKLAGKGRARAFNHSMRHRVQRKLELENGLRKALENGQFLLHYQPIVSLDTGQVDSFEALARWVHPQHGLISPGEFIPVAEETDLIVPLGEWVFQEACRQLAAWWKTHGRQAAPAMSVNLSRNQLVIAGFGAHLRDIALAQGVDPTAIHLEVTESAIMCDTRLATQVVREIKDIGFKVAMDDFGTGYSSLACLHQFPIDVLKIDRSFIANLERGRDFAALVNAIAMLAGNLGMRVVAEGVETESQITMLQSLECQLAQGFYFAPPMPADKATEYLAGARPWLPRHATSTPAPTAAAR